MKRTCLQENTNTDEQNSCEFHPVEQLFEKRILDPKDNQFVKSFVRMKRIITTITLVFITICSFSQNPAPIGSNQLNFGVGFSGWGVPVYVGFDHGVARDLTLGGELSYRSYREKWDHNYYDQSITGISANLNYHFNRILVMPSRWDLYAGLNLGFFIWNSPSTYYGDNKSGLGLRGQIGIRYYLSNKVGLNLEFGGGNAFSGGKFGVTIKI